MRVRLTLEYDGAPYCGWQVQPGLATVQGELERAVERLTGERVAVIGSGRTDAGVHALGQVAHFDTAAALPPERVRGGLNHFLPPSICVLRAEEAADGFHARYSARRKTYLYRCYYGAVDRPLLAGRALRLAAPLDLAAVRRGAELLVGTHDFAGFMNLGSDVKTTVRTVERFDVAEVGGEVHFTVTADGFLYNMVRLMTAALLDVGARRLPVAALAARLKAADPRANKTPVPAGGLYLVQVEYD